MCADLFLSQDQLVLGTNSRVLVYHIGESCANELMFRTKLRSTATTLWHAVTCVRSDVLPRTTSFVSLHFENNILHFSTSAKISGTMRLDKTQTHIESLVKFKDISSSLGFWNHFCTDISTSVQMSGDRSKLPVLTAVRVCADSSVHVQTIEIVKSPDRVIGSCVTSYGDNATLLILLDSGEIHSFVNSSLTGTRKQQQNQQPSVFSFFKSIHSTTFIDIVLNFNCRWFGRFHPF